MSYIELSDDNVFNGVFPLEGEIGGTEFCDGLLIPLDSLNKPAMLKEFPSQLDILIEEIAQSGITDSVFIGNKVSLYRIHDNKVYTILF
ncbi:MAG: hypothetical protein LBH58_09305 [Tannerellaceae bacterium]|jgi:hypothetical protein|nr:hypothetical protein [Tannerellaceae bacterium]